MTLAGFFLNDACVHTANIFFAALLGAAAGTWLMLRKRK